MLESCTEIYDKNILPDALLCLYEYDKLGIVHVPEGHSPYDADIRVSCPGTGAEFAAWMCDSFVLLGPGE